MYTEKIINLGGMNHPVMKVDCSIESHQLSDSDGKKLADVNIRVGEFIIQFSIIEGNGFNYAINPFISKMDNGAEFCNLQINGLEYHETLGLLRELGAIAVDYHKVKMLEYSDLEYEKIGNRNCSNCRYKAFADFNVKELSKSRRIYCSIKNRLIDIKVQEIKDKLAGFDMNKYMMKEKGIIVSNPEMGADASYRATIDNLLGSEDDLDCRHHHYAYKQKDGNWYTQPSYSGHMPWDFEKGTIELPNAIVSFKLEAWENTLYELQDALDKVGKHLPPVKAIEFKDLPENDLASIASAFAEVAKLQGSKLDSLDIVQAIRKAKLPTVENTPAEGNSLRDKLIILCKEGGITVEEDGSTSLDFLLETDESTIESVLADEQVVPAPQEIRDSLKDILLEMIA